MKKTYWAIALFLTVAVIGGFFYSRQKKVQQAPVHYHAGFQVIVDNRLEDFSGDKYMHIEPCVVEGSEPHGDDQEEKAHLHDAIGNVVHVHRNNALWKDLFANIGYPISQNQIARSFVNGKESKDILNTPIQAYDSVLIFIGKADNVDDYLKNAVSKETIQAAENKSENCGS